tara:strand:+ start:96 stop:374 length:279 start_codon:yes stop_codon:yes gene_type:complete
MKAVGFIKEPQTTEPHQTRKFEAGDWVVLYEDYEDGGVFNLYKRIGIVTDFDLRICWLDNGILSIDPANSEAIDCIRHATKEELAAFNLKGK